MESQQDAPVAPPRRRNEDRSGPSSTHNSLVSPELNGSEHPALRAQEFHRLHRSAVEMTLEAQTADEEGKRDDAFKAYNRALHFIDQAVILAHQGGFSESDVNRIDDLTYKLRITRKQILERVSDLQIGTSSEDASNDDYLNGPSGSSSMTGAAMNLNSTPSYSSATSTSRNPLPSYEDAVRTSANNLASCNSSMSHSLNYRQLVSALDEIAAEQDSLTNPLPLNAHEVFTVSQNVQIYYISPDDNVSAPSYPSFLRIVVTDQSGKLIDIFYSFF